MATYTKNGEFTNGRCVVINGVRYLNPTEAMLLEDGWTKVVPTEPSEEELAAQARAAEVENLKMQLAESDYKVIKIAECVACSLPLPYDAEALHSERQALRDRINELEEEIDAPIEEEEGGEDETEY